MSRGILKYLTTLGNTAASKRLSELDQMCEHLTPLPPSSDEDALADKRVTVDVLSQTFSFDHGAGDLGQARVSESRQASDSAGPGQIDNISLGQRNETEPACGWQTSLYNDNMDLSNLSLEGEDGLYWLYHAPGLIYTGVELDDWQAVENQIVWGPQD